MHCKRVYTRNPQKSIFSADSVPQQGYGHDIPTLVFPKETSGRIILFCIEAPEFVGFLLLNATVYLSCNLFLSYYEFIFK